MKAYDAQNEPPEYARRPARANVRAANVRCPWPSPPDANPECAFRVHNVQPVHEGVCGVWCAMEKCSVHPRAETAHRHGRLGEMKRRR